MLSEKRSIQKKSTSIQLYCTSIILSLEKFYHRKRNMNTWNVIFFLPLLIKTFVHFNHSFVFFSYSIRVCCIKSKNVMSYRKAAAVFVEWVSSREKKIAFLSLLTHRTQWWNKRHHLFRLYKRDLIVNTSSFKKKDTETKDRFSIKHEIGCQLDWMKKKTKNPRK
jgi:hypothetical protein